MVPAADLVHVGGKRNAVLIDVTSLIGAEDFILAQNNHRPLEDPFARQCFVEIIQSLIYMPRVYVPHPTLARPSDADFGEQPLLLRSLVSRGLVTALQFDEPTWHAAESLEAAALRDLQSADGLNSVVRFVGQARLCDQANSGADPLSERVRDWSAFQEAKVVGISGHHSARIQTSDGIEDDEFGEWARAAGIVLRGTLAEISAPGAEARLMATLVRGIRYRARADAVRLSYQSHPLRRDFLLTFELTRGGAGSAVILDVIKGGPGNSNVATRGRRRDVRRTTADPGVGVAAARRPTLGFIGHGSAFRRRVDRVCRSENRRVPGSRSRVAGRDRALCVRRRLPATTPGPRRRPAEVARTPWPPVG